MCCKFITFITNVEFILNRSAGTAIRCNPQLSRIRWLQFFIHLIKIYTYPVKLLDQKGLEEYICIRIEANISATVQAYLCFFNRSYKEHLNQNFCFYLPTVQFFSGLYSRAGYDDTRKIDSFDNFASFFNRPLPHGKKQRLEKDLYC